MSTALIITLFVTVLGLTGLAVWIIFKAPALSTKIQALLYAAGGGAAGYIAYFLGLPQNLQTGVLGELINLCPASWQPAGAAITKTLSTFLTLYATYKAAHSGPQTPPTNPPK